jgi:hypothetical protein
MTIHLSSRLTWHDTAWDGRVCSNPLENGLTFVYAASFFLLKPQQTANLLRGSRVDWIPPRIRGTVLLVFGLWWTLVGIAGIFG